MANNNLVKVGLHFQNKIYDLQFSKQLTFNQLATILPQALEIQGVRLPDDFELELINKPIVVNDNIRLDHYPLGDGDQIKVKTVMEEEDERIN